LQYCAFFVRGMPGWASNSIGHRDATMILLAFRHGLWASEICALRWEQMDLAHGRLHVSQTSGMEWRTRTRLGGGGLWKA
jgi:hypothetical protein